MHEVIELLSDSQSGDDDAGQQQPQEQEARGATAAAATAAPPKKRPRTLLGSSDTEDEGQQQAAPAPAPAGPEEEQEEAPEAAAAREEQQRQGIMAFARAKRARSAVDETAAATGAAPAEDAGGGSGGVLNNNAAAAAAAASGAAAGASGPANNNSLLAALRLERERRHPVPAAAAEAAAAASGGGGGSRTLAAGAGAGAGQPQQPDTVSLLTWNIWFNEDAAPMERMQGVAAEIEAAGWPTFVCLQEVTHLLMDILSQMPWWQRYSCIPVPPLPYFTLLLVNNSAAFGSTARFENIFFSADNMAAALGSSSDVRDTEQGRSLQLVAVTIRGRQLLVGNSHLESPMPTLSPPRFYTREREQQMRYCLAELGSRGVPNTLFAGDMNWNERQGKSRDPMAMCDVPLPPGWADAWLAARGGGLPSDPGFTFHPAANPMISFKGKSLKLRLDRVFAKLRDFEVASARLVGTERVPGVTYMHQFKNGKQITLPVLPSDHFGLLVQLRAK